MEEINLKKGCFCVRCVHVCMCMCILCHFSMRIDFVNIEKGTHTHTYTGSTKEEVL
jgi:hypothetical protein